MPLWRCARAAAAATAAATVIITFQLAGKATRDALFLSTFGVAALPPIVIAAAVLSAVLAIALARVMSRTGPAHLVPRLIGLSATLLLAEWALAAEARRPAAIIVYLHLTAFGAILVSGFWAIVNERFDPRTARRTVGRIAAGGSLGGLLGGVLPERVGAALSLTAMLPILAGLHLVAAQILAIDQALDGRFDAQGLRVPAMTLPVRAHTVAQVLGFADVENLACGVLVQIHAGRARNFFEFFVESHCCLGKYFNGL